MGEEKTMSDLRKSAKKARKQIGNLDLSSLRGMHLEDVDLNFLRKREEEAASKGFLGGFLLGVLVGAVIALVFAPRRGEETRELVAHTAGDLKVKATDLVHQVRSDGDGTVEPVTSELDTEPAIERNFGS